MDNEIIQIFFDPASENIDWEKRKTRKSQQITETPKEKHCIKQFVPQHKSFVHSEMTEDFSKFIADINIRIDEYKNSGAKELLKQLDEDYKILCVNFNHFGQPKSISSCINKIRIILHKNTKKFEKINKQEKRNSFKIADRGIPIQKRLSEIKSPIKNNLSQNENINHSSNNNKQNGQTKRGIEIQKELSILRDEIKRKDLNPIEKENLRNALLKLQNELNLEMNKFSKFDSIPIRLDQIENYLNKLKDKEEISKQRISFNNEKPQDNKSESPKKHKMKVIWKFGL